VTEIAGRRIEISGVVQGVGFRPFVYNLARGYDLRGWVCNTSAGVEIEVEGDPANLTAFIHALTAEAPPLAHIDHLAVREIRPNGDHQFEIRHSVPQPGQFQPISPDICICDDCLRELFDPADRRYLYPFINCTNCGPRFTIIQDIPYDRPNTTMRPFVMCPACQAEYDDPTNRRFHAQPNACPVCGPTVELVQRSTFNVERCRGHDAIVETRRLLAGGAIVAVKGLGGFHLACDATNDNAVRRLRERKGRVDKPFALMAFDVAAVGRLCFVDEDERQLLECRERPIVLLRERPDSPVSPSVAPGNRYLGVMLPYTPLHYLLLANRRPPTTDLQSPISNLQPLALVMTSGNFSEEPIATDNAEALARLSDLADAFLLHDRDIHARCDDSVVRVFRAAELPIRRSRGYAPYPVHLPFEVRQILAVGGELKNTFCLTRGRYAFLSQHIGDMENLETLQSFEAMVEHFKRLFRITPEVIAYDLHPNYLTTRYAWRTSQRVGVQHHHAHIAACMAENGLVGERPVIGVAFDGTGYGTDGAIWGGEFLVADYAGFRRAAHLAYVPLPGGDAAIRHPYRTALAHLWHALGSFDLDLPPVHAATTEERRILLRQLEGGLNAPPTSSIGRLFDAVAAIVGVRQSVNYEAQAAIELENLAAESIADTYLWDIQRMTNDQRPTTKEPGRSSQWVLDPAPLIRAVVADVQVGVPVPVIAAKFHNAMADLVRDVCVRLRRETGLNEVALSGGVWQNVTLLGKTLDRLAADNFVVYTHRLVPPNDGGLSLGQAVIANASET
jgi:hydrogenase maturation protein HypF